MSYIQVDGIGKCECCHKIINITDYAGADMEAIWLCKHCGKPIEGASFGYNPEGKRERWIGPLGEWVNTRPTEEFSFDGLTVFVQNNTPR